MGAFGNMIFEVVEPDTVNEPVIWASPVNGNGVVEIPKSWEPSPK